MGVAYTATVVAAYGKGFGAITTPWLAIPAEDYYLWESFFTIPAIFLLAMVFAVTARLLARSRAGRVRSRPPSPCSPSPCRSRFLLLWLPETTFILFFADHRLEPLGGIGLIPVWADWIRQALIAPLILVFATMALRRSENLSWPASAIIAIAAFIPYTILTLLFIR